MQFGWIVFALAVTAVIVSLVLLIGGKPWYLWLAGFLYAAWAILGYLVDIARPVAWRSPILWPVFIPYVLLYLSSLMFYWWPLGNIQRPLWFIYAVLFVISTVPKYSFTRLMVLCQFRSQLTTCWCVLKAVVYQLMKVRSR